MPAMTHEKIGDDDTTDVGSAHIGPVILLAGVAKSSALGKLATDLLTEFVEVAFSAGNPPRSKSWKQAVLGTAMQWWTKLDSMQSAPESSAAHTIVNLDQQQTGQTGLNWCIVDGAGTPLFQPFHALQVCRVEPYVASLNLIESRDRGVTWQLVAEAAISSARSYSELLDILGRTAIRLLRMALCNGPAPRRPWVSRPFHPGPSQTLLDTRFSSALAWLRSRIGGELYGIAMLDRRPEELLEDQTCAVAQWLQISPAQGFIADPFFWPGRPDTLLCETYLHSTGLGELSVLSVDAGRIAGSEPLQIGLQCHLSYPSTWADGGRVLCLPEMAASRRQLLYELQPGVAPRPLCTVGEDIGMADPTLMKVNNLYWIAYTDTDIGTYDNLCLLYADRLEGPWFPHAGNPIKIDARSSRPGGTPFWVGDQLFRPAQDCSREYGGALVINRVQFCSVDRYHEEAVATLRPDPDGSFPDGLHTLSFSDGIAVIDGKRNSYHPAILANKLRRRLVGKFGGPPDGSA